MDIPVLLDYFKKVVFEGDLDKLIQIGRASEKEVERRKLNARMSTQSITTDSSTTTTSSTLTTTVNIQRSYYDFDSTLARCAIPMAVTLISTAQFFGILLNSTGTYSENFDKNVKDFFDYGALSLHTTEKELLRAVYRNGMMHSFFPKGNNVEIEFDSSAERSLFKKKGAIVSMNVVALHDVVKSIFEKIESNVANFELLKVNFNLWEAVDKENLSRVVEQFKNHVLKKEAIITESKKQA
ncbi:MAG: hypothetical protein ABIN80_09980 [Dyadobacter sp.]|uniref:hypothetical protein n=1 Tax=Dyadobacter sp. TaxID=1914288 RepID=UPI0032677638